MRSCLSFISIRSRGEPLVNCELVVALIGATPSGFEVKALLDTRQHQTGTPVFDK